MNDQDLDKLFENTLSEASFPFNEAAWAGAEKAIIAHEAAKRRRGIIIWFLTGLLLSGTLGLNQYSGSDNFAESVVNKDSKNSHSPKNQIPASQLEQDDKATEKVQDKIQSDKSDSQNQLNSDESGNFKSNYNAPNYGQTKNLTPIVFLEEDLEKQSETSEIIYQKSDFTESLFLADFIGLKYAEAQNTGSGETYNSSAGRAGEIYLPDHWNTKVNLIAGIMPLDYFSSGESSINRMPFYAGIGISKIHNYSIEYGAAILFEELIFSDNEKTIEQTEYGFGKTVNTYRISRSRGNYITVPVYLKFRLRNNHALMTGIQFSRLLQSYSTLSLESENLFTNSRTIDVQQNISGYNKDLSNNQLSLIIAYELTLSDRLRLQLLGRLGANSLYKNQINESALTDRMHLRLGIEYSIWRF
ncbi:MAG: hypothetical protein RLN79_11500 [Cytophagales bacterium]